MNLNIEMEFLIDVFEAICSETIIPKREEDIDAIFDVVVAFMVATAEKEDVFEDDVVIVVTDEVVDVIIVLVFAAVVDEGPMVVVITEKDLAFLILVTCARKSKNCELPINATKTFYVPGSVLPKVVLGSSVIGACSVDSRRAVQNTRTYL